MREVALLFYHGEQQAKSVRLASGRLCHRTGGRSGARAPPPRPSSSSLLATARGGGALALASPLSLAGLRTTALSGQRLRPDPRPAR